jgi:glycosyltransferase involved in cell wall biosynthesis
MKIAVYTIALNEEQFVQEWYNSAKEADYLLIADTGSTDNTVELATKLGIHVVPISIKPWRFDDARNASLSVLPDDIDFCISLDMDEVLLPGWREELEKVAEATTRPRYQYTWNWKADGTPGLQYGGDKIHRRHGYRWKHPVHETLTTDRLQEIQEWIPLEIHHHADDSKPRSQYLPLLAQAIVEDPYDDRNAFYYARELFFYDQHKQAAEEFKRHLELPKAVWPAERAASYRYLAKCEPQFASYWLKTAVEEDPGRRESLVDLALHYYTKQDWVNCLESSIQALAITEKPLDYLCEEFAWGATPWDLAALSAYYLGDKKEAIKYGTKAVEIAPNDKRLGRNLEFYQSN